MMVSFCAVLFPRGVLDEILNLIESVSEGFHSYSTSNVKVTIRSDVKKCVYAIPQKLLEL